MSTHSSADRRAHRFRLRHRARCLPEPGRRRRLAEIAQHSNIPVIADIHFQPKYVYAAIDAGCAAVRVNQATSASSTIRSPRSPSAPRPPGLIRIGVNAGSSLDKRLLEKYGKADARGAGRVGRLGGELFGEHDFHDFKISVKHNDPVVVKAYELLAERGDWPLHLGVTEAGPAFQGTIKSATAFGALLSQGSATPSVFLGASRRGGEGRHPDPGA